MIHSPLEHNVSTLKIWKTQSINSKREARIEVYRLTFYKDDPKNWTGRQSSSSLINYKTNSFFFFLSKTVNTWTAFNTWKEEKETKVRRIFLALAPPCFHCPLYLLSPCRLQSWEESPHNKDNKVPSKWFCYVHAL